MGSDTINDNDLYPGANNSIDDKVTFAAEMNKTDVQLVRNGDDLIITITGAPDQLKILGQFRTTQKVSTT